LEIGSFADVINKMSSTLSMVSHSPNTAATLIRHRYVKTPTSRRTTGGDRAESGARHLQVKKDLEPLKVRRDEEGSIERLQRDLGPMYTLVLDLEPFHTAAVGGRGLSVQYTHEAWPCLTGAPLSRRKTGPFHFAQAWEGGGRKEEETGAGVGVLGSLPSPPEAKAPTHFIHISIKPRAHSQDGKWPIGRLNKPGHRKAKNKLRSAEGLLLTERGMLFFLVEAARLQNKRN
jgi:hypothetical protein